MGSGLPRAQVKRWVTTFIVTLLLLGSCDASSVGPPPYVFVEQGVRTARIEQRSGMPVLLINDQPVPPLYFFFNYLTDRLQYLQPQVQMAATAGVHVLSMPLWGWTWEGQEPPDFSWADREIGQYLAADPKAVLILRMIMYPPDGWEPSPPLTADDDSLFLDGSRQRISPASEAYHQGFVRSLMAVVRRYEASPYSTHILAYVVAAHEGGEWFSAYREKGLDYSPVNQLAFRGWLASKYQTDTALSQGWGRPATLAEATIPIPEPGRFPVHSTPAAAVMQAFYLLPQEQDWVDYSQYIADLMSSRILDAARAVKLATDGKKLTLVFHGYIYSLCGSMTGHLRLDRLLNSPDVDMIGSPISYLPVEERLGGGAGGSSGPQDSVALSGKMWFDEDDLRTWLAAANPLPDIGFNGLPTTSFDETEGVLQRNLASALAHRGATYWMDLNSVGAFEDSGLWSIMENHGLPAFDELYSQPSPYRPQVALITDAASVAYEKSDWDLFYQARPVLRNALAKTGAQVGHYTLADFVSGKLPACRVYVFANAWYLTDDEIAMIRQRLDREGATAIWQYAAGFLGPSGRSVQRMENLTGIRVRIADGLDITNGVGALQGARWGWGGSIPSSPRFIVSDDSAEPLGRYWADDEISAAQKRVGHWHSVYLGSIGWNSDVLRRLLEGLGVQLWGNAGDTVHTDGRLLVIHSGSAGTRSIKLPASVEARSMTGELLARPPQRLTVSFSRPGETQWFRLGRVPQARRRLPMGR